MLYGYIVEGHMTVEDIATLFDDEPEIDGIALLGMRVGSPEMGGSKTETRTGYGLEDSAAPSVCRKSKPSASGLDSEAVNTEL